MLRRFETTTIRKQRELSGQYWGFSAPAGNLKSVFVPSCWENYPGMNRFRGTCSYQTTVNLKGNERFVFKGVSFYAKVFLNDRLIGEHYNAYTPFECIVKNAAEGDYTLRVEVSNAFSDESALHVSNDYRSWGGITRGVIVESISDAYIRYIHAIPFQRNGVWHASLITQVVNVSEKQIKAQIAVSLADENVQFEPVMLKAGERKEIKGEIVCPKAITYQPNEPKLYQVRAALTCDGAVMDDIIDRVGFREVTIEDGKICLNGKPVIIRGFNRHETHGLYGCAIPVDAMAQDLALLQDVNANAVRTCHYPNDELFLDLCDELGILVWEESHARGLDVKQIQNPHFRKQSLDCIQEMIEAHMNHPSIFIWGCLNECPSNSDYGRVCYQEQLSELKRLDPSRPATTASRYPGSVVFGRTAEDAKELAPGMHNGDICLDLSDIISFNIYPKWYVDIDADIMLKRLVAWVNDNGGAGKPFLISEIGGGAIYGFHSSAQDGWSEEKQADIIEKALQAIFAESNNQGVFLWQFCDGLVDEGWSLFRPKTMNNKGIVDEFRRPKLSYDVVKRIFAEHMD